MKTLAILSRGRCRHCHAPIDPRHWQIELAALGIGAIAGLIVPGPVGLAGVEPPLVDRLIGGIAGFAALWLVGCTYKHLRGREGLGGGDPKLLGAIGLWLGWRMLPAVLLLAALIGFALVLLGMLRGRAAKLDDRVPFGALLAIAAYPAWLFLLGLPA